MTPTPIQIAPSLAARLHAANAAVVEELNSIATDERFHAPGLREACTAVLKAAIELEQTVRPAPANPVRVEFAWLEWPGTSGACPVPVALPLQQATELASRFRTLVASLDTILGDICEDSEDSDETSRLKLGFGRVMGLLFTEFLYGLLKQHPELEPEILGSRR